MFCLKCGQQLPEGSKFCFRCGADLPAVAVPDSGSGGDRAAQASVPLSTEVAQPATPPSLGESVGREAAPPVGATGAGDIGDNSVLTEKPGPAKTVITTDDSLRILADRNLSSDVLALVPKGTEIELGGTSTLDGREWIQAKLKSGRSGYVLAPSARGHTTLASERTVLVGMAPTDRSAHQDAPDPLAGVGGWLILLIFALFAGPILTPYGISVMSEILTDPWFFTAGVVGGALGGWSMFIALALLNRWPNAPRLTQTMLIGSWLVWAAFWISAGITAALAGIVSSLVGTVLWVRYLSESWRVHVTYGPMPRGPLRLRHAAVLAAATTVLIVVAGVGIAGHRKQAWGQFLSDDGTYKVEAPGSARKSTLADGTTQVVFGNDTRAFAVLDSVVGRGNSNTQGYFETVRDKAVGGMNGSITSSSSLTLEGRPGLQFSATFPGKGATGDLYGRVYRAGSRGFLLLVSGPQGGRTQEEADRFFRSFHVVETLNE